MAGRDLDLSTTLRYSFYLACSWLWCLGGFFPLILNRDYGWPALAAFTIFNVGGAIAMGFYFKNSTQQQAFETRHKPAIAWFSYITIAYQLFFIGWLGSVIGQIWLLPVLLLLAFAMYVSRAAITHIAVAVFILSIGLFIAFMGSGLPPIDISAKQYWPHALLPLAIGFVLSPYLDITFHRAYKDSSSPKLTFALGFGVLFLSLLGFVFFYSSSLSEVFFAQALIPAPIIYPIIGFLLLQVAFTVAAHAAELVSQNFVKPSWLGGTITTFSLVCIGVLTLVKDTAIPWLNLPIEETIYKSFLFFYSLVFPLYLLLGKHKKTYLWVLAICTPAYSVGFLIGGEQSFSLSVGVAILAFMTFVVTAKRKAAL